MEDEYKITIEKSNEINILREKQRYKLKYRNSLKLKIRIYL